MNFSNKQDNKNNEDIKEQFNDLKDKTQEGAEELYGQAKHLKEKGKEKTEDLYSQAKESLADFCEEGKKNLHEAQDVLKSYSNDLVKVVRERPLSSLLVAGGLGLLLSLIINN